MSDSFDKRLGEKIRELREQTGFSQENLARLLKINRVSLSQVENGKRKISAEEIFHLSRLFNVSADILLNLRAKVQASLTKSVPSPFAPEKPALRISVPQSRLHKLKEALLYILEKVGSKPNIVEAVLYKLLYFIDFNFYEKYEEQLIGATYIKNPDGPTPVEFKDVIRQMVGKDLVRVKDERFQYPRTKYIPMRECDLTKFNAHETRLIDEVLEKLSNFDASQLSEYLSQDVPWVTTEIGEVIKYEKVFYRQRPYSVGSYDDVQENKTTA